MFRLFLDLDLDSWSESEFSIRIQIFHPIESGSDPDPKHWLQYLYISTGTSLVIFYKSRKTKHQRFYEKYKRSECSCKALKSTAWGRRSAHSTFTKCRNGAAIHESRVRYHTYGSVAVPSQSLSFTCSKNGAALSAHPVVAKTPQQCYCHMVFHFSTPFQITPRYSQ